MTASLQHATSQGNDLPQGYKRTEVGVIPVDWEVKRLGEVEVMEQVAVKTWWNTRCLVINIEGKIWMKLLLNPHHE